jgi:2-methylcitrate dehydratase PrpD
MSREIDRLAEFVVTARWQDVPGPVRRYVKLVLRDTLGVILAGSERPEVKALTRRLATGGGAAVYARGMPRAEPRMAALLNGIAGRSIELCEGLRLSSGQAAMQVLPAVLAVGEARGNSGAEILAALLLGYEVAGRLSRGFTPRPLAHQNGQVSLIAAAAAGARLYGLDAADTARAMRIATTLLLTPSYLDAVAGASALNVAGGMSGFAGALAPELALAGFAAREDAVETALGQLIGSGFSAEHLCEGLGEDWQITRNYFRLHACCNPIHPALDCLAEILGQLRPQPGEVEGIEVATYRFASVMSDPAPANYFASKYSLPHAAAAMVVRGNAGFSALDDSALQDPAIAALRARVHVAEDEGMSALVPRLKPARVTVRLADARQMTRERQSHRGDFDEPFSEAELRGKFRELAATVLTADGVAEVEAALEHCEEWRSLDALLAPLRRHSQ